MKPTSQAKHQSVMANEIVKYLVVNKAHSKFKPQIIDATLGAGGHSLKLLKAGCKVLALESDENMRRLAEENINTYYQGSDFSVETGNFREIREIAHRLGWNKVDGIIFDLGVSLDQLTDKVRGFSFTHPKAGLDMRLNPNIQAVKACDLLNLLRADQMEELFTPFLYHSQTKRLVREIIRFRKGGQFTKVGDLVEICNRIMPRDKKIHPATKVFLALRVAVNSELENLKAALPSAMDLLRPQGRLAVISFHSLEDGLVKKFMMHTVEANQAVLISKKPIYPTIDEIKKNPRARSAILRVIEKL